MSPVRVQGRLQRLPGSGDIPSPGSGISREARNVRVACGHSFRGVNQRKGTRKRGAEWVRQQKTGDLASYRQLRDKSRTKPLQHSLFERFGACRLEADAHPDASLPKRPLDHFEFSRAGFARYYHQALQVSECNPSARQRTSSSSPTIRCSTSSGTPISGTSTNAASDAPRGNRVSALWVLRVSSSSTILG